MMNASISQTLARLQKSTFRSRFYLTKKECFYLEEKGMEVMKSHAADFVSKRLASAVIPNDGKQTPMHGHPVFKAMHATACCCRGCLEKWHGIPKGTELDKETQQWIVLLLMSWLEAKHGL